MSGVVRTLAAALGLAAAGAVRGADGAACELSSEVPTRLLSQTAAEAARAVEQLRHAGLSPRTVRRSDGAAGEPGRVVAVEPVSGTRLCRGALVILYVAEPVVPDLAGASWAEAQDRLVRSGLTAAAVPDCARGPGWQVQAQWPRAGRPIDRASGDVLLAMRPRAAVHHLDGQPLGAVRATLRGAGWDGSEACPLDTAADGCDAVDATRRVLRVELPTVGAEALAGSADCIARLSLAPATRTEVREVQITVEKLLPAGTVVAAAALAGVWWRWPFSPRQAPVPVPLPLGAAPRRRGPWARVRRADPEPLPPSPT